MTIGLEDLEKFTQQLKEAGYDTIYPQKLRKAIAKYWNIGSPATVDNRIEMLKDMELITPSKSGKLKLNKNEESEFGFLE